MLNAILKHRRAHLSKVCPSVEVRGERGDELEEEREYLQSLSEIHTLLVGSVAATDVIGISHGPQCAIVSYAAFQDTVFPVMLNSNYRFTDDLKFTISFWRSHRDC